MKIKTHLLAPAMTSLLVIALPLLIVAKDKDVIDGRSVKDISDSTEFDQLSAEQMQVDTLYYHSREMMPFQTWKANFSAESESLALYPGYDEPKVAYVNEFDELVTDQTEPLIVFVGRSKTVLNRSSEDIDVSHMMSVEAIKAFDATFAHKEIKVQDLVPNLIKPFRDKQLAEVDPEFPEEIADKFREPVPINSFDQCLRRNLTFQDLPYVLRPKYEIDLQYTLRKDRDWCSDPKSICIESCYAIVDPLFSLGLTGLNTRYEHPGAKKDFGFGTQSELRYFTSEVELALPVPVQSLTGLDTAVVGGLEQSIFYSNQIIQFGKVISILQKHPTDPSKTVMTTHFVLAIETGTYEEHRFGENKEFSVLGEFLMGRPFKVVGPKPLDYSQEQSILGGLPNFSKAMIRRIAHAIEAGK